MPEPQIYEFNDFRLDAAKRLLLERGEPLSLTPRVFDTLLYLVEHQGQVLEKGELMKAIWPDSFVEENNLTQNISTLRRVLGETRGENRYIVTVPGRGYRFAAEVTATSVRAETLSTVPDETVAVPAFEHMSADPERRVGVVDEEQDGGAADADGKRRKQRLWVAAALSALLLAGAGLGYWMLAGRAANPAQIESIAVLPFINESGNPEVEYLADGMTDSLINSLSRLPHLSVKARSTVFRYKGKEVEPQQAASELSVQAILNGRIVLRGNDLVLYLSLVDTRTGNQLWGEQYNRKLTDIIALQSEIARDVSQKLRTRLSGVDEQKVVKNYTANAEAYQLYLRGRYHVFKLTPPEVQKGIQYLQQAIEIDPTYALAYVGLSEAYRSLALGGEMIPTESLPKAKAAAQKAIDLDDALAEAHMALGVSVFWYDWRWDEAERQYKRALELNPNSADTHLFYAHVLSNTGQHAEALAEIKRARELDPLSPFISAQEGQFLLHAGRTDEALDRLQKSFELAPNFWLPHVFAAGAYIDKGMYAEASAEARRAKELSPVQTVSVAYDGYALAKSGKRDEARAVLEGLLKLSRERFVPPYHIALIYNALDERAETLAWLERGIEQRDPKITFLKVDPKWNNLRADPRFQDLLRRVGFTT
jgi:TolB-like protein/DNA-binding winged helix-turn-helix (wHTH) protein/Flp pilus assembly protein TadD